MARNAMRASLKLSTPYWLIKEIWAKFLQELFCPILCLSDVGLGGLLSPQTSLEWLYKAWPSVFKSKTQYKLLFNFLL